MNPANLGSVPEYKIDQRSQTYFNDRNALTINHDRVRVLCLELESLTLPYRDPTGQIIQLWKSSRYGLVGAVLSRYGKITIIQANKIINPLNPNERANDLVHCLESAPLKKWDIVFDTRKLSLSIWPHLVASGKYDNISYDLIVKDVNRRLHNVKTEAALNRYHYTACQKEGKGGVLMRSGQPLLNPKDNQPFDHRNDVSQSRRTGINIIKDLKNRLEKDNLTPEQRKGLESLIVKTGKILDESKRYAPLARPIAKSQSPSQRQFEQTLKQTRLEDSYKSTHRNTSGGKIGGVGNEVGLILGLFDSLSAQLESEHAFFMPVADGKSSLSGEEIQQVLRELAIGIFVHDTVPFFSLHFNGDTNMYPIIHPAYEKTLVGHVISMLDYYMKGFLNGGFFYAAFVEEWNRASNKDEKRLKENIIDVRRYCAEHLGPDTHYRSIREIVQMLEQVEASTPSQKEKDENPLLKDYSGFRSSFRIIARQNSIRKTEKLFTLDGDFDVLYTIVPDPAYEEEIAKYRQLHGENPPSYKRLEKAYEVMCEQIKTTMPRLPEFKKLFEALNLINFFCYYFNTLKKSNRFPLLPSNISQVSALSCPPLFPHLPIRAFYLQKGLTIQFSELFSTFPKGAKESIVQTFILLKQPEESAKQKIVGFLAKKIREYVCEKTENSLARRVSDSLNYEEMALQILNQVKELYNDVRERQLPTLDKEIAELERGKKGDISSYQFSYQPDKAQAKIDKYTKKIYLLKEKRRALVNDPFSVLKPDASFRVNLESADSLLYLYSEQPDEEQRTAQKRMVGGCGLQLDRKPLKVDPAGYSILDHNYGPLSKLQEGEILQVADEEGLTSGVMFKLGFTDLLLLDGEDQQAALGFLSPPNSPLSDAMIDVYHAISTSDEELFKKATDQIVDWNVRDASGISLLHHAARSANLFIIDYLAKRIRSDTRDSHGYTPLHYAAEQGNQTALLTLLSQAPGSISTPASGGQTPLYLAVQNNHLQVVKVLLSRGADPNCMTSQGMNALMCAIYQGFSTIALELLKQSTVNLEHSLDDKITALHLAVECDLPQVVEQLLAMGMDVNRKRWDGSTALHLVAKSGNLAILQLLVNSNRVALDLQLKSGKTALHLAAENDHYENVELLLKTGANPALFGWEEETALHVAVKNGCVKSVLCLLHFMRERTIQIGEKQVLVRNLRNKQGETALKIALKFQMNDLWPFLLDLLNDNPRDAGLEPVDLLLLLCHPGVNPNLICSFIEKYRLTGPFELKRVLEAVAQTGHNAAVSLLLSKFNIQGFSNSQGWTIHHFAAKFDHINLFSEVEGLVKRGSSQFQDQALKVWATIAAQYGRLRVLKVLLGLLDLRKDLNRSILPIFCAAVNARQYQAVDLIIHKIVNPNIPIDENGRYATHLAVINDDGEMLELLYKRGAKFDVRDKEGYTPLHYAVLYSREDTLEFLLDPKKGIPIPLDLLHIAAGKGSLKSVQLLLEHCNIDTVHPVTQNTPLFEAIENDNSENAAFLYTRGANLCVKNSRGETPFLLAAQKDDAILKLLLHSDVASQTRGDGKNALHLSVINGFDAGVEILLQQGFDPTARDGDQRTPADYAKEKGHFDLIMMLEGKGLALRQRKQSIVKSLLNGNVQDFLSLIEGMPLNRSVTFTLSRGNTLHLPLLHLIYLLVGNKEKKLEILKAFSLIQGVNLEVKNLLGQTLLHLAGLADQDPPFEGMNVLAADLSDMTPLHLFAQSESLKRFQTLFTRLPAEARMNLDLENEEEQTPLFHAIEKNRLDIVLYLLESGANPNHRCKKLQTPLGWAVEKNSLPIIRALVARGAQVEDPIGVKYEGPLHIALRKGFDEIARWLIENGAPVMQKDSQGREPIHVAAGQGNLCMIRLLHACGASLFAVDRNNDTIAHFAVESKCPELIDFLKEQEVSLEPYTIDGKVLSQTAPVHIATRKGNLSMLARFSRYKANFDVRDKNGNSALFHATLSGNPQVLQLFSRSPLMEEADQVTRSVFVAIRQDDVQQLRILWNELKNINQRLDLHQGLTMLHIACMMGADRIVHLLLKEGADPLLTTYDNVTPFGFAVLHNHFEIAYQLSLHTSIDPNYKMTDGSSYLHLASEKENNTMIAFLVALGALLDATDAQGRTALHVAVSKGNRNAIKLLLCIGASSAVKTLKGETAYEMTKDKAIHELMAAYEKVLGSCPANGEGKLHAAVRLGDADAILALSKIEDVYQRDKQGRTPLHKAVSQKNLSLLRTVIEVASDLEVEDGQGKTPLFIAAMEVQDPALVRFLLKAGANPLTGLKDGTSLLTAIKQAEESKSLNDILKLIENYK